MKIVLRVFSVSVLMAIISELVWFIVSFLSAPLYADSRFYAVWSKLALSMVNGKASPEFMAWAIAIDFVSAVLFVIFYRILAPKLSWGTVKNGLFFALMVFAVGVLPGYAGMWFMIYLPLPLLLAWVGASFVVMLAWGLVTAVLNKK